ncbi:MAG: hypothetical protein ABIL86_05130 [candidate division WOR-3 bacterium]
MWCGSYIGLKVVKQIAIKKSAVYDYQQLTANYQRFRRARLVKIYQEMIQLINFIERGLTKGKVKSYLKKH